MPHWKHAIRKGTTLAVVALLHLLIFVYLTMPPAPEYGSSSATMLSRTGALQLVFLKHPSLSYSVVLPHADPVPAHALPRSSRAVGSRKASVLEALDTQAPAETLKASDQDVHNNGGSSKDAISVDSSYGNPLFKAAQEGSQALERPRIPGHADRELVKTISVGEPPSPRRILQEGAQFLNCSQVRMARFLSASEMDKRHITTHELDQAFTELGCT